MNNKTTLLYPILLHSAIASNILLLDLRIEVFSEVKTSLDNDFNELNFEIKEICNE